MVFKQVQNFKAFSDLLHSSIYFLRNKIRNKAKKVNYSKISNA